MADDKRSLLSETVITQIEGFIQRNGGDHDGFVVGLTGNVDDAFAKHLVNRDKHPHFVINAVTPDRAGGVVKHFRKQGCTIGENEGPGFIYCYRRAFDTSP